MGHVRNRNEMQIDRKYCVMCRPRVLLVGLFLVLTYLSSATFAAGKNSVQTAKDSFIKSLKDLQSDRSAKAAARARDYVKDLQALQDQEQKAGNLESYLALKNEIKRFETTKKISSGSDEEIQLMIKNARDSYYAAAVKDRADEKKRAQALAQQHIKQLEYLKKKLTMESKLDEALAAKKEVEILQRKLEAAQGGLVDCSVCYGSGSARVSCRICRGRSSCSACRGNGYKETFGKMVKCLSCGGTGNCRKCEGEGREKQNCAKCSGSGKVTGQGDGDLVAILLSDKVPAPKVVVDARPPTPHYPKKNHKSGKQIAKDAKKEIDEHVKTVSLLRDLFQRKQASPKPFDEVIANRSANKAKLFVSDVNVYYAHPRSVKVASSHEQARQGVTTLIPHSQMVGNKTDHLFKQIGKGARVTITYGVVNQHNIMLFDINRR